MMKKFTPSPKNGTSLKVPIEQMDLPVSFSASGEPVTLRQYMEKSEKTELSLFSALSPRERAELTVKRIEAQPSFEMAMIGGGILGKQRAIEEVRAQTDIGLALTEIEQRVIQSVLRAAQG